MSIKNIIKKFFNYLGYDLIKKREWNSPFLHISQLIKVEDPIIFDVGSNIGQTIHKFKDFFDKSIIYAFEPSITTFNQLKTNIIGRFEKVNIFNFAIGSEVGESMFYENSNSAMSSFLHLGEFGWGEIIKQYSVKVDTVDNFCEVHGIKNIDCLKIDAQGFELEIFKGSEKMMDNNAIGLIYFEVTFSEIYQNLPTFGDLCNFLESRNFKLVSIYKIHRNENSLAAWTDVLFVHNTYLK